MFAVIFSATRTADDGAAYGAMAQRMEELATAQPGFIKIESARNADGFGITVSYWETEADIANWKAHADHLVAQERGRTDWYSSYTTHVAEVGRSYSWGQ